MAKSWNIFTVHSKGPAIRCDLGVLDESRKSNIRELGFGWISSVDKAYEYEGNMCQPASGGSISLSSILPSLGIFLCFTHTAPNNTVGLLP